MKNLCTILLALCFLHVIYISIVASSKEDCFNLQDLLENIRKYSDKAVGLIKAKCKEEHPNYDDGKLFNCIYKLVKRTEAECYNKNTNNRKEYADCFYNKLNIKGLKRMPFTDYKRIIMKSVKNKNMTKIISHTIDKCNDLPEGLFTCSMRNLAKKPCPELKRVFMFATTSEEAEE